MKFRYIRNVSGPAPSYKGPIQTGDILELDGHFAMKAMNNPDFEQVNNNSVETPPEPEQVQVQIMPTQVFEVQKKVLSPEHLEKLKAGRERAKLRKQHGNES